MFEVCRDRPRQWSDQSKTHDSIQCEMNTHIIIWNSLQPPARSCTRTHRTSTHHRTTTRLTTSKSHARHDPGSAAKAVEGAALALERVDDVHGGDGLAAGVLRVGDGVADDVLEEDLEHATGLLVDQPGDALHAAPPRQPPDRRLRDPLDVVAQHLPVPLRAALSQALASLASA
ncbi:hypothetical protein VPH35_002546 [Triticum aestivum]|uniref:Uncharacterized protein n=1 Tax=Triticum urartu TaxID=4572 RepID=A0A8R7P6K8_TRIUA